MRIVFKNFGCYENKEFDLGTEGVVLISGGSGKGKTTILKGIYFALYGKGNKITQYGKTSCKVDLYIGESHIMRNKKPNRLVLDELYEDEAAQSIINERFGNAFDVTSYISQNAINSFILMSPIEKLGFLEKFAFQDIDLANVKKRCKSLIKETNDILVSSFSQLELITNMLLEFENPKEVKFPLECKPVYLEKSPNAKKCRDKLLSNERIRYKNAQINIKKSNSTLKKIQSELISRNILNATISAKELEILSINIKIKSIQEELDGTSFNKDELKNYEKQLESIISNRELKNLLSKLKIDKNQLEKIKESEINEYKTKINEILTQLWNEYTKDEINDNIIEYKKVNQDIKQLKLFETQIKKYEINTEKLKKSKEELFTFKSELEHEKQLYTKLTLQKGLYNCPSCKVSLKFKNNKINLVECDSEIYEEISELEVKKKIDTLMDCIEQLELNIQINENKYSRYIEIQTNINKIMIKYQENFRSDYQDIDDDLEYMIEYNILQTQLENKKNIYEKKLESSEFSQTLISFEKNITKQELSIKILQSKVSDKNIDYNEEKLRVVIEEEKKNNISIKSLKQRLLILNEEKERHNNSIHINKNEYMEKYENINDIIVLESNINDINNKIKTLNIQLEKHSVNFDQIKEYNDYEEKFNIYNGWSKKMDKIKLEEKINRKKHAASTSLQQKILEAESIAMINVIESINTHAQSYLELFFQDHPISVQLLPFKETKKSNKPQINLQIEYKSHEIDINTLSGGELSRVVLAFTLALAEMFSSPIILLDECTASLDQELTSEVIESIRDNCKGKLVLLICHQVVKGVFDKVIIIE
jgi:DNA repair exonuclease SbcCD ATPase subunit